MSIDSLSQMFENRNTVCSPWSVLIPSGIQSTFVSASAWSICVPSVNPLLLTFASELRRIPLCNRPPLSRPNPPLIPFTGFVRSSPYHFRGGLSFLLSRQAPQKSYLVFNVQPRSAYNFHGTTGERKRKGWRAEA